MLLRRLFRRSLPAAVGRSDALLSERQTVSTPSAPARSQPSTNGLENNELRNAQIERRCFILCNGPSVKKQSIAPLAGEFVISVSNGYHHPDFLSIAPLYHCVPQITYGVMTPVDVIAWFREMHGKIGDAALIMSRTEQPLITDNKLFEGRQIYYLDLTSSFADLSPEQMPDLTRPVPGVQSVAIMAIMLAMWVGSKDIYLVGTDHDHFRTGEYKYFFEPTILRGKDNSVDADGKLIASWHDELHGLANLWSQYRSIKSIAAAHKISITNSTAGGELDEFPRRPLHEVIAGC